MYLDTKMNFLCQSFKIYSITDIKNNDEWKKKKTHN